MKSVDKKDVRIPMQKRSIEKKEKIIDAGYHIFTENGYFSTTTADIAKEAGLSTGSVYAYFSDKKDILLACLNKFGNKLTDDICEEISILPKTGNLLETTKNTLKIFVKSHNSKRIYHDEISSLEYLDEDVKNFFTNVQKTLMDAVINELDKLGYVFKYKREQSFLLFQMVRGIEDELVFNHTPDIDHDVLIEECARIVITMMVKKEN